MLDSETKRRIDTARDILVGKVPDPKSQVEQITIALIYKFMDDMDAQAEEVGGKRKFFTKEFAAYGWAKLMAPGVSGEERIALYADGMVKMTQNPAIPPLFRSIFKNAYLPYRDPETLKSFLKIINDFSYDHSERLGDAYEYLVSVLGSQGNAGQFRTPRHIIDFIVKIVDPKKNETVLDPACGTAGFLISAYKHILAANTTLRGMGVPPMSKIDSPSGILLTPDERKKLADNFRGYDIDPGMIRLSLVNMYLHGFKDPHIDEYDTLTSQDRWNDMADVILANPPFMSPKGGIRPHNRFSIQAKRSEVLFVDYMAEHLTPAGRAGIIVPEGIIFQSQTAYKALRKMLVEQYLVAVVSLPGGVFQPYSGVKTSILILDKSLAKQSHTIAFFKIENDGFGLGAQRRETKGEQLTQATIEIAEYFRRLRARDSVTAEVFTPGLGLIVTKEKLAANGDFNLSGDRYREGGLKSTNFPWVKIQTVVEAITPPHKIQKTDFATTGRFPIIDQSQDEVAGWTDNESVLVHPAKPLVIFGDHTCAVKIATTPFAQGADGIKILQTTDVLDPRFLFHVLRLRPLESSGYQRHFSLLKECEIPLPPLEVQKEIVAEIEGYQKVIDGARAVLDHYRPRIPIHSDWPLVELERVMERYNEIIHPGDRKSGELTFVGMEHIEEGTGQRIGSSDVDLGRMTGRKPTFKKGHIVYGYLRPYLNKVWIAEFDGCSSVDQFAFEVDNKRAETEFVATFLRSEAFLAQSGRSTTNAQLPRISISEILNAKIPLPPLATQQQIVAEIEAEQRLVAANRELIERFEKKIAATLARIWGDPTPLLQSENASDLASIGSGFTAGGQPSGR